MTTHDEQTRAAANSSADEAPAPRHESSEGWTDRTNRTFGRHVGDGKRTADRG